MFVLIKCFSARVNLHSERDAFGAQELAEQLRLSLAALKGSCLHTSKTL